MPLTPACVACKVIEVAVEPMAVTESLARVADEKRGPESAGVALMAAARLASVAWIVAPTRTVLAALCAERDAAKVYVVSPMVTDWPAVGGTVRAPVAC